MAGLPPRPDDPLPPRLGRGGTSPRAASMRNDLLLRERDRDREDRRRRSPRPDNWRRPPRSDDRYQDQPPRKSRDWEDERHRPRVTRDRVPMDTYVPERHPSPRRRSSPHRWRSRSRSRSRDPRSPRRRPDRSQSPYRPPRSRSPPRRRPSPYPYRPSSRERHARRLDRSMSPRTHLRRRSPEQHRVQNHKLKRSRSSRSRSPGSSGKGHDPRTRTPPSRRERSRSKSAKSPPPADALQVNEGNEQKISGNEPKKHYLPSPARKLPAHPPPSGPRRPRTPTGPRTRTPAGHHGVDEGQTRFDNKGKSKKYPQVVKKSPPRGPRKRPPPLSLSRSRSRSHHGSRSHSPTASRSRSRSRSSSSSHSHSRSRSLSRSRSSPRSMRSRSSVSPSRSLSRSRSRHTRSERLSPRAPTGPRADRKATLHDQTDKMLNIDDLIQPMWPRPSKTIDLDLAIKSIQEQRAKLEKEHVNIMRGVRRAQHELDLAAMEQKSAEERRKAAERVHERTVKGFLEPIT